MFECPRRHPVLLILLEQLLLACRALAADAKGFATPNVPDSGAEEHAADEPGIVRGVAPNAAAPCDSMALAACGLEQPSALSPDGNGR